MGTLCPGSLPSVTGAGARGSGQTGEEVARGPGEENEARVSRAGAGLVQVGRGASEVSHGPHKGLWVFKASVTVWGLLRKAV